MGFDDPDDRSLSQFLEFFVAHEFKIRQLKIRSIIFFFGIYRTYENLTWIDTMGFDDPDIDDNETFQDMLRYLHRQNLTKVKAIIWTVHPGTIR